MDIETIQLTYEGGSLPAAIYRPQRGVSPGIVVATGGLERGDIEGYRWAGERLAAAGYTALLATYRAASPYNDPADLSLAVDWLENDPRVDGSKLAVWGHSRGGLAALFAAARDPRLRAVISIAAPADPADYLRRLGQYFPAAHDSIARFLGDDEKGSAVRYESVRALSLAGVLTRPVLLLHGTADMRVPIDQSVQLEQALREAGNRDVRLEMLPGVGHFFELTMTGYQFDRVMELTTAWLSSVLD